MNPNIDNEIPTKNIAVLLLTYNGEKYLREQLTSIFNQIEVNVQLFVRDDGSNDGTIDIISEFQKKHEIYLNLGTNIGVANSFFELLESVPNDFDYYALADQDDVWYKDKLSSALKFLCSDDRRPVLYCSALEIVDEKLDRINVTNNSYYPSYCNSLVENIVTGCTCLFNNKAKRILKGKKPSNVLLHDWWLYLVISFLGEVIYDKRSFIKYRQHQNNVVGSLSMIGKIKYRIKKYILDSDNFLLRAKQAENFFELYSTDLTPEQFEVVTKFINSKENFLNRIQYAFIKKVKMQRTIDNGLLFFLILINRY